jgi:hypothetical protein
MMRLTRCLRIPAAAAGVSSALPEEIAGSAAVLDGDTIRIGETRKPWLCGIAAREAVSSLIANRPAQRGQFFALVYPSARASSSEQNHFTTLVMLS